MKKLAIIGANYLQLPLVQKANAMGFQTHCFAYLDGAVCKEHCYKFYEISIIEKDKILAICRELKIDGVISIASDLAVITVNYIAHHLNLPGNPLEYSSIVTNKYEMKTAFSNNEIPVANFAKGNTLEELNLSSFRFPIIIKPSDRSGSLGVSVIDERKNLESAFKHAFDHSFNKQIIAEEFITGRELSVETISYLGHHTILAYTDKTTTGPPSFVETEHHQPANLSPELSLKINTLVHKALDTLNIVNGASHVELFIKQNKEVVINEIGARMGGDFIGSHLVELSTGYDYLKSVIDIATGIEPEYTRKTKKCSGIVFRTKENGLSFDHFIDNGSEIVVKETNLSEQPILKKSGDRGNYFIYQSDKRIKLA